MKKTIPTEVIESCSYTERRFIIYLLGKKGKPGMLLRNTKEDQSKRLQGLINLINKNIVTIVDYSSKHIYFKLTDSFENKKISVSLGQYI